MKFSEEKKRRIIKLDLTKIHVQSVPGNRRLVSTWLDIVRDTAGIASEPMGALTSYTPTEWANLGRRGDQERFILLLEVMMADEDLVFCKQALREIADENDWPPEVFSVATVDFEICDVPFIPKEKQ